MCSLGKGEIKIRQAYVHGNMQDGAKTRVSKSSVMMHLLLAEVMKAWQMATLYGKPDDYVFASYKLGGRKPRTGSMIVEGLFAACCDQSQGHYSVPPQPLLVLDGGGRES